MIVSTVKRSSPCQRRVHQPEPIDPNLWALGITTSHVPTVHPVMAAKQATTVDHISNGRFALNVVCGWFRPELEMFGAPLMEHDMRYEYAAEWVETP